MFLTWIWLTFIQKKIKIGLITGCAAIVILTVGYFSFPKSIERFTKTVDNIKEGKGDCRLTIRNANRHVMYNNYAFGVGTGDRNDETVKSYERYKDSIIAKITNVETPDILLDSIYAKFDNSFTDEVSSYIDSIAEVQNADYSILKKYTPEYQTIKHCIKHELNAHNQFNDTIIAVGILGLIILLSFYILPIYIWIKNRTFDIIFFSFLLIFVFNSLFESIFERQMGIMFFVFFYFLLFHVNFCQQTTDNSQQTLSN